MDKLPTAKELHKVMEIINEQIECHFVILCYITKQKGESKGVSLEIAAGSNDEIQERASAVVKSWTKQAEEGTLIPVPLTRKEFN